MCIFLGVFPGYLAQPMIKRCTQYSLIEKNHLHPSIIIIPFQNGVKSAMEDREKTKQHQLFPSLLGNIIIMKSSVFKKKNKKLKNIIKRVFYYVDMIKRSLGNLEIMCFLHFKSSTKSKTIPRVHVQGSTFYAMLQITFQGIYH